MARKRVPAALAALALAAALAAAPAAAWAADGATSVDGMDANRVDQSQRADNSFIYDTSIGSLYSETSLYDGQTVQVVGEVVGDRIESSDDDGFCWITLTETDADQSQSISVLLSDEFAAQIDQYGRYNVQGTHLQVRGTYHAACADHSGLSDVHATAAEVVQKGKVTEDALDSNALGMAIALVVVGGVIVGAYYYQHESQR